VGKVFDGIDSRLAEWIAAQPLFFVGSAPLAEHGHVNVSPKGPIGTLHVLDERTVAYLDIIGSGAETIAHVRENGRLVIMLCAFSGPPRILRLHGSGEIVLAGDDRSISSSRDATSRNRPSPTPDGRSCCCTSREWPTAAATACR
jgi:hypothetical protein